MNKITVYYNANLKMSDGKLASQVAHAVAGLTQRVGYNEGKDHIVVLKRRQQALHNLIEGLDSDYFVQYDLGLTEIEAGALSAVAVLDNKNEI